MADKVKQGSTKQVEAQERVKRAVQSINDTLKKYNCTLSANPEFVLQENGAHAVTAQVQVVPLVEKEELEQEDK